jgi:hypothetical protein
MYLSLPLPAKTQCEIDIVYVPYLPYQRQRKMTIYLNKDAKTSDLKQEVENNIRSNPPISNDDDDNHSVSYYLVEMVHQVLYTQLFFIAACRRNVSWQNISITLSIHI